MVHILFGISLILGLVLPQGALADRHPWQLRSYVPPPLPHRTSKGDLISCDKEKDVLFVRTPSGNRQVLASKCPSNFYGEIPEGIFVALDDNLYFFNWEGVKTSVAGPGVTPSTVYSLPHSSVLGAFGNGLYLISKDGKQTKLKESAPNNFYGYVPNRGAVASFPEGLLLLKFDGTSTTLAAFDSSAVHGFSKLGIIADFGNGLYLLKWNGVQQQLVPSVPTSIREIKDDVIVACYTDGLFNIDYSGKKELISPTCER